MALAVKRRSGEDLADLLESERADERLARVLERVPGLTFTRNGGMGGFTGVRLRGAESEQVLVLLDGVRVAVTGASNNGVFRWAEAEAALSADFSAKALAGLTVDATDMIGDLHGTPAYRANLVKVLTGRAVTAA
mgnify:CR=1 FL=1